MSEGVKRVRNILSLIGVNTRVMPRSYKYLKVKSWREKVNICECGFQYQTKKVINSKILNHTGRQPHHLSVRCKYFNYIFDHIKIMIY